MSQETAEKVFEPYFTTSRWARAPDWECPRLQIRQAVWRQGGDRHRTRSGDDGDADASAIQRRAGCLCLAAQKEANRGREAVLLVEDDAEVRSSIGALQEDLGYSVLTAASSDAALRVMQDGASFDLLISDVIMPGDISRREMAERIQVALPGLAVLFLSGYSRDAILRDGEWRRALSEQAILSRVSRRKGARDVRWRQCLQRKRLV